MMALVKKSELEIITGTTPDVPGASFRPTARAPPPRRPAPFFFSMSRATGGAPSNAARCSLPPSAFTSLTACHNVCEFSSVPQDPLVSNRHGQMEASRVTTQARLLLLDAGHRRPGAASWAI